LNKDNFNTMSFESYEAESLVSRMPEPSNDNFIDWHWSLRRALMLTDVSGQAASGTSA
jgi:hypothetical protein